MASDRLLESVSRALDILELLDANGEMSNSKIAEALSQEKTTIFRTLKTLKARKYVRQDPETFKFSNSYKIFEMGHNVARNTGLPKMAFRYMRKLASSVKGAINLGVLDDNEVVYIDKIESSETVKVCLKIGQRIPLHCTGLGKALLAHRSEPFVRSAIGPDPLRAFTDKTLRTGGDLLEDLAETRRRGYAVDDEEHFYGIVCVAAPAFNAKGETIAALSVAVTRVGRDPHNIDVARLGEVVREAAEGLSNTLGGQPPWRSF